MAGIYDSRGALRVTVVSGSTKTGLYASDGSINIYDATGVSRCGAYHPCGAMNINVVSGDTFVGRYALNGAINVTEDSSQKGDTPSGAVLVTGLGASTNAILTETGGPILLEDGSGYILTE